MGAGSFFIIEQSTDSFNFIFDKTAYKDNDIIFNLTTATTVITSVFTLKAIRENREAYHIHQTSGEIMPVGLDVLTTQELWDELFEKL